jgi:quinoprotein relay system zinc metallohydrolase 1
MKRRLIAPLTALLVACGAALAGPAPDLARLDYALQARQIAPQTWVLEGAVEDFNRSNGCNIINTGFIATGAGVVVVNTGPSRLYGEQQRRAIARVTQEPVLRVLNLNLHPDYFFGNQAWADRPVEALSGSQAGMQAEGANYATNLYRLCGDWMKDTESTPARQVVAPQSLTLGSHRLEILRLDGHTGDDMVLVDHSTGVVFAGGLVFADRVPTTPHADVTRWLRSLDQLEVLLDRLPGYVVVPSHGPVHRDRHGMAQTRDWLQWVTALMTTSARQGLDLSEVLQTPLPDRFKNWAAQPAEFHRTLTQWYPRFEAQSLVEQSPVK